MQGAFAVQDVNLTNCRGSYSFFFDLIEKEWAGENRAPIHRICSLMRKMGCASLLREELEANSEILEEIAAVETRVGGGQKVTAKAVRITFFRSMPTSAVAAELTNEEILGYAVILRLSISGAPDYTYLYEAVVRAPSIFVDGKWRCISNYYVHCTKLFETQIGSKQVARSFKFPGTFFCQQNGATHVCAHAALRIALNNWPTHSGPKVTSKAINVALDYDHTPGKRIPDGGLTAPEIKKVVEKWGFGVSVAEFISSPEIEYDQFVYPLIESGCPAVLGIVGPKMAHVVAVIGHTLNTDRWAEARHTYGTFPSSPFIGTTAWVDHFIVSDDNFGMYVTLPTDSIRNLLVPKHNPNLHAALAVGLVPGACRISGYAAEQEAARLVNSLLDRIKVGPANHWILHLQKSANGQKLTPIVCRTLMASKTDYANHIKAVRDEHGSLLSDAEKKVLDDNLPDRFWVTEISTTNLYSANKRKLGDVVTLVNPTDAQMKNQEWHSLVWLPGICLFGVGLKSQLLNWSLRGHVPLLRGIPSDECGLEW